MIQSPCLEAAERKTSAGQVRVAAYCRVSTEKEEQLDSLARQKEFFMEYAEKMGHVLVQVYADEGVSGTSLRRREAFKALIRDARQGRFDLVVAKDISRFARNTVDFLQSIRLLKSLGINTVFLTANMESLGDSEFILTLFSALAQEESINLSKRVKFGKKINAKKGRVPVLIFGYRRLDNFHLEIDPEEAAVVRLIYQMYLKKGFGFRRISRQLNELGMLTKLGCQWEPKGVRRILTNPIYCGHYVNNKYEIADVLERRQVLLPAEENYHHPRPDWAIIKEEEYLAVQAALAERSKRSGTSEAQTHFRHSSRYAFSGLIRCAECGYSFRRIHDPKKNNAIPYWLCSSYNHNTAVNCENAVRIPEDQLLQALREHLDQKIGDRTSLAREILPSWDRWSVPVSDEDRLRETELRRLQNKMKRYQELYSEDLLTISDFREKREKLQQKLDRLSSPSVAKREKNLSEEDCKRVLRQLLLLEDWDYTELHRIIQQIRVENTGNVTVLLRSFGPGADPGPV